MKLGLMAGPDTISLAVELGATGVPLPVNALALKGPADAVAPLADAGLEVCQIAAFGFNSLSPEEDKQEQQRIMLQEAIPKIPATGCNVVVVNGGNYDPSGFMNGRPDSFTDDAIDAAARGLEPMVKLAEEHGVIIAVEPMVHAVVCTPERFLKLKEKVGSDALTVNLDICNFLTYADMWRPTEAAKHICETLAGHYALVHCKDLTVTTGVHIHIDETSLGTGVMDWETALRYIARDLPEDGYFIYEHVKTADDARAGAELLRSLAQKIGISFSGGRP